MAAVFCSKHPEIGAVGKCFRCEKPYCLECLDLETGKPLCSDCSAGKPAEVTAPPPPPPRPPAPRFAPPVPRSAAPPVSKLNEDTFISLDDLNFDAKAPEEVKQASFKVTGPLAFVDSSSGTTGLNDKPGDLEEKKEQPVEIKVSEPLAFMASSSDSTGSLDQPVDLEAAEQIPVTTKVSGPLAFMDNPSDSITTPDKPSELEVKKEIPAPSPVNISTEPVIEKPQAGPAGLPPLVFSPMKSLDNDPLGLFKKAPLPSIPVESPKPAAANPFADLPKVVATETKHLEQPVMPLNPSSSEPRLEKPGHVPNFDLAGMMNKLEVAEKTAPKTGVFDPAALIPPQEKVSINALHAPKTSLLNPLRFLAGSLWLKFNILAAKLRISGYLLAGIIFVLLIGGLTYFLQQTSAPVVKTVESIPQITVVPLDISQVNNLDITAFTELSNHLGPLGFPQLISMTVPQLLPNFFDVGLNTAEGTYSEILIMPNQIGPRLSFVTVFSNGVWYSTNGWAGTNQQLDYLVSEFYPDQSPEQLYAQHKQGVEKLQTTNGWQIQNGAGQDRYMADLSDHLRWFLKLKNIPSDQAEFASWH
jgi:hypothetical protein